MELEQARKRAEELRVIIEKNNRLYSTATRCGRSSSSP